MKTVIKEQPSNTIDYKKVTNNDIFGLNKFGLFAAHCGKSTIYNNMLYKLSYHWHSIDTIYNLIEINGRHGGWGDYTTLESILQSLMNSDWVVYVPESKEDVFELIKKYNWEPN